MVRKKNVKNSGNLEYIIVFMYGRKKNQFFDISELTKGPPAVLNLRVHKGTLIELLLRAGKALVRRKEKTCF